MKHVAVCLFLAGLLVMPMLARAATGDTAAEEAAASEAAVHETIAGETPATGVEVELNKLEPVDNACRAYLVVRNRTDTAFESLRFDLVMFDRDSIVAKRLAVEAAPLPADKTTLKVFDINELACENIGQILLNDVLACRDASGSRSDCLDLLSVTSRGDVPFLK